MPGTSVIAKILILSGLHCALNLETYSIVIFSTLARKLSF